LLPGSISTTDYGWLSAIGTSSPQPSGLRLGYFLASIPAAGLLFLVFFLEDFLGPISKGGAAQLNGLVVLLISFFGLVLFRVPIAFSMGLSSMITAWSMGLSLNVIMRNIFEGVNSFSLLAVPFFLLAA